MNLYQEKRLEGAHSHCASIDLFESAVNELAPDYELCQLDLSGWINEDQMQYVLKKDGKEVFDFGKTSPYRNEQFEMAFDRLERFLGVEYETIVETKRICQPNV